MLSRFFSFRRRAGESVAAPPSGNVAAISPAAGDGTGNTETDTSHVNPSAPGENAAQNPTPGDGSDPDGENDSNPGSDPGSDPGGRPESDPDSNALVRIDMMLDGWVSRAQGSARQNDSTAPAFHLFGSLPYDLRRRIWHTTMERRRIVFVSSLDGLTEDLPGAPPNSPSWSTLSPPPAIFSVCQESRHEALAFYRIHLPHRPVYVNPDWDTVILSSSPTLNIDARLCHDLLRLDPLGVGVKHYGHKGTWQHRDGSFEPPVTSKDQAIWPLGETLKNLRTFTEVYELHPPSELQEVGGYLFPRWRRREGYFERDRDPTRKSAYHLPSSLDGYKAVLVHLSEMVRQIVPAEVAERTVVQTFHVMPMAGIVIPGKIDHEDARISVGQYGKIMNMIFDHGGTPL